MTDLVEPSFDSTARSRTVAAAIRYAGASEDGWVQPSSSRLVEDPEGNLSTGALSAFSESHSGSSLDVTINSGEGLVGGAYFARDTSTTVTLASSTNNQSVYAGWEDSVEDSVIIGLSGAFTSDDPKMEIWQFDTDSNGVSSATDQRNTDNFRIRNEDVQSLQNFTGDETTVSEALADGGNDEMDADELAGANGTSGQVLTTDGSAVSWSSSPSSISEVPSGAIMLNDNDGASLPSGYVLCDGNNGTPDLRNRYVKGANGTGDEGDTGGSNTVTLSTSEIPSHTHSTRMMGGGSSGSQTGNLAQTDTSSNDNDWGNTTLAASHATTSTGGGGSHQNEPAFTELRYMMKS